MLEEAVLAGKAVQLWELPACLHMNESLLREFFARHFNRTAAARIKTVVFSNNSGSVAEGRIGGPPRVGGEATVEFFEPEGVELVLSRIIQHELVEQDGSHHVELRRGFIYLGQDRMLVEGVVHLLQSSSAEANVLHESNSYAVSRKAVKNPHVKGGDHVAEADAATTHTPVDVDDERRQSNKTFLGSGGMGSESEEEEEEAENNDDDCSDQDGNGKAEGAHQCAERSVEFKRQTHSVGEVDAVVLCMTFVCVFDCHQQGGGGRPRHDDEAGTGVTPHAVFQLLRGTCFVRKVVIFNREDLRESGSAEKRRIIRALVEVGEEEVAKRVEEEFHGTTLELIHLGPRGEEVEYRYRIYARYKDDPRTHRQLAVPLNTQTALSVTPRNIAMMGPVFRREWCDREAPEKGDMSREAPNEYGAAAYNRRQEQEHYNQHYYHRGDSNMVRGNDNSGGDQASNRRRRERSGGERHRRRSRRRSNDREDSARHRRQSRERHNHRQHTHDDDERRVERHGAPAVADNDVRRAGTMSSSTFEHHHQLWRQWQLQKQQELELQKKTEPYASVRVSPHGGAGGTLTQHPDAKDPLPHGWRAVYSDEHKRYYYVHRDSVTGVEISSWTVARMP
ncbi:hypothetical protein TRSC58_01528 [Trypanosoma rangeli SC58]|uniref:WW domain-containing protein n=1 Tax=Trypanosoma rangeli SC58 TaxID=429131 RepID=A0A061J5L5_TRYRA|nr:hypothetical protein TRSC58_01528 [Trypanosoma rangeli SC58]